MPAELPVDVDCRRLLSAGGTLTGTVAAARMARIDGIFRVRGATDAQLALEQDDNGRMVLTGSFVAPLEARCQRCLEWMAIEISADFELDVVERHSAPEREEDDLVEATNGRVAIVELIEDEILLACPMIPLHQALDCRGEALTSPGPATDGRRSPFAGLGEMMKTRAAEK